ncbi:MAG TPA: hypothetical protein ENK17_02545 [Anaerolineae bacterium]|nr:hypothetical protein [Anaerolineae bacterium]
MTTTTHTTHRRAVSAAIVAIIAIVAAWSIGNIAAMARVYHPTAATWLLGVAIGVANAVSVYVLATANSARLRRPAIVGAIVFGGGSAIIQTGLYLLDGAAWPIALAFGSLGPLAEGILAWQEAELRRELAQEEEAAAIQELRQQLDAANAARQDAAATIADLRRQLSAATRQLAERQGPPPQPATAHRQPAAIDPANLSPTAAAKLRQVAELAARHPIANARQLAQVSDWSERTAQRYLRLAQEAGLIVRNGDGRLHPTGV